MARLRHNAARAQCRNFRHPAARATLESSATRAKFAAAQIHRARSRSAALLENFSPAEVRLLAHFMDVYQAPAGVEIIREGDGGDFMLMLIEGKVEVHKRDRWNTPQLIAQVEAGKTLGEMSMIDGEARFATCVAAEPARAGGARPREPRAHHRRAADARRQDPDGAGADAVAAPALDQRAPAAD
mgnify:CR=1 FL=1